LDDFDFLELLVDFSFVPLTFVCFSFDFVSADSVVVESPGVVLVVVVDVVSAVLFLAKTLSGSSVETRIMDMPTMVLRIKSL
jgi:hypothetical protein